MSLRLVSFVVRRTLRLRPKTITRVIPFMVELSDNINIDHVYSMCTTMMETEAATLAVQMVLVIIRLGKLRRK